MPRLLTYFFLLFFLSNLPAQKVLQIEKFGKIKTQKIYLGEVVFIKTKQNPDIWFEASIDDLIVDAQAIVFYDRIILIQDITALKFKKKGSVSKLGKQVKLSGIVPATYELIYGLIDPPIHWENLAIFTGGAFILGSIMEKIPAKKHKFGKRRRLRVLDLTFYSTTVPN